MKTFRTILLAAICLFTSNLVTANDAGGLKVNMEASNAKAATVEISSVKISHIEIDVVDSYGENLYTMKTKAPINSIKKKYDFSQLEDGVYWYIVKIDKETTTKTFEVDKGVIEITEIRKSIEPFFKMEDDLLKFTYMNPQLEDVNLVVYNKDNRVLAESDLGNEFSITKAVDFSKKSRGDYDVVISNDKDVFEYTVSIR